MPANKVLTTSFDDRIRVKKASIANQERQLQVVGKSLSDAFPRFTPSQHEALPDSLKIQQSYLKQVTDMNIVLKVFQDELQALETEKERVNKLLNEVSNAVLVLQTNLEKLPKPKDKMLEHKIYNSLRLRVQYTYSTISELITYNDNHQASLLEHYCKILNATNDALPNQQRQVDQRKIAALQQCASEIKDGQYHPNTGLRKLAGILLLVAGALALLLTIVAPLPVAIESAVIGVVSIGYGYGFFKHGVQKYPDAQNITALAEQLQKVDPAHFTAV